MQQIAAVTSLRALHHRLRAAAFYPLSIASVACVALVVVRVAITHRMTFSFLVWNLFLAWVPYVFTPVGGNRAAPRASRAIALGSGALWLLFLPNAPYLVTDLVHLRARADMPFWFDASMLAAFAFTGLALMIASLARVHGAVERRTDRRIGWIFAVATLTLSSLGVYLGRVLRWNSWDAIVQPGTLARHSVALALDPSVALPASAFTCVATAMLLAMYAATRERFVRG